jgi:hypothetical protein
METSSPFDLDQALWHWRAGLQNLGGIHGEELEELEGHLRESISVLHAGGLSAQEAFMVATRRLGSERQLADEFAKANPRRAWTERALWMVAGVLAAYTLTVVARPLSHIFTGCALRSGLNGHLVAALDLLSGWIVWAGGAAIAYWILSRHSLRRDHVVAACIRQPVLAGLGLFIGLECLQLYWWRNVMVLTEPVMNFFGGQQVATNPQTMAIMTSWSLWEFHLTELLWIAAVPLLAGYAWRKREQLAASGSPIAYELQPGEDEVARALQGQGISRDEASLVLARRRCPQEVVAPPVARVTNRGIWLERAVWMVTGVALSHCLQWLVLQPALIVAATSGPAAPLLQHLAGLVSVSLGLTLAGAIIAGLWRWITRHPRQSASIGRVCRLRPVAAAMALVMVCAGIGFGEYALFTQVILPANLGIGAIGSQWMMYGDALTYLLIPITLLLWLARRWRSIQTNPAPCR